VVSQVLEWSLSSHDGLDEESEHGEHSKTSVLDLLDLELSESIWVVSKTQWVEWTSWVERVESLNSWGLSGGTESLSLSHEDNLASDGGNDGLSVDQRWVSEVVESVIGEDGGSSLEPDSGISEVSDSVVLEELWGQASEGSQHSPTGVDDLELSVLGESLWVSGETGGIPSVVSWELSSQVRWSVVLREWSQPLGSVCTTKKSSYETYVHLNISTKTVDVPIDHQSHRKPGAHLVGTQTIQARTLKLIYPDEDKIGPVEIRFSEEPRCPIHTPPGST
jgi:hypothetical protein